MSGISGPVGPQNISNNPGFGESNTSPSKQLLLHSYEICSYATHSQPPLTASTMNALTSYLQKTLEMCIVSDPSGDGSLYRQDMEAALTCLNKSDLSQASGAMLAGITSPPTPIQPPQTNPYQTKYPAEAMMLFVQANLQTLAQPQLTWVFNNKSTGTPNNIKNFADLINQSYDLINSMISGEDKKYPNSSLANAMTTLDTHIKAFNEIPVPVNGDQDAVANWMMNILPPEGTAQPGQFNMLTSVQTLISDYQSFNPDS
ncbi:MAG: hypothetical protein SP1CHLAM54_01450 [Chlamydiia bacterium]|nr:hypothetical protein [Chlamydiia bacterium]MCH9615064.1 hypothetical protein [Chlamydiia bacterium]MCH9628614.1 hypothetical protein [Chlamydiia bacterium]